MLQKKTFFEGSAFCNIPILSKDSNKNKKNFELFFLKGPLRKHIHCET
ncbi:unnamed protein product [Ixodes pacificus]